LNTNLLISEEVADAYSHIQ